MSIATLADLAKKYPAIKHDYLQKWAARLRGTRPLENPLDVPFLDLQSEVFSQEETFRWPGKNLLVAGPPSSGKTLIAEVLMGFVQSQHELQYRKCIYAVPLRALATEKYKDFLRTFDPALTAVSSSDYRTDDASILFGDKRIIVVVYEKLYIWLVRAQNLLERTALLVVDELHMVGNPERGAKLEMILTWARDFQAHHPAPTEPERSDLRIVGLAPSSDAVQGMKKWLGADLIDVGPERRPVPLIESIVPLEGEIKVSAPETNRLTDIQRHLIDRIEPELKGIVSSIPRARSPQSKALAEQQLQARRRDKRSTSEWDDFIVAVVTHYLNDKKKVLVYRASKRAALRTARALAKKLPMLEAGWHIVERELKDLEDTHERDQLIKELMPYGVGIHHGDMNPGERQVVERRFRGDDSTPADPFQLCVLVATPTLGMGLNLPADVVVMADYTTFRVLDIEYAQITSVALTILEYRNYAGRAGRYSRDRPDHLGICVLLSENDDETRLRLQNYLTAPIIPIRSTLDRPLAGFEPYVLATVGWLRQQVHRTRQSVEELFGRTYAASLNYAEIGQSLMKTMDSLRVKSEKTDAERGELIDVNLDLINGAAPAAAAAISLDTYIKLAKLQGRLEDMLDKPLALLYALALTQEVRRLYPTVEDWDNVEGTAETVRSLRAFYRARASQGIDIGEASSFTKTTGIPGITTLKQLIRAAAVWSWMQGDGVMELAKYAAFPGIRWGHLSDLGDNFSALVETLGRMWIELSGTEVEHSTLLNVIKRVHLLSLQLRHGVPAGVEEVANLKVPGWHRERLLRLWKEQQNKRKNEDTDNTIQGWDHPYDILDITEESTKGDLRSRLGQLQEAIKYHREWLRDARPISQRQRSRVITLLIDQPTGRIDENWPEWIKNIYSGKDKSLEPILLEMLRSAPFSLDCFIFDKPKTKDQARADIIVRLPEGGCLVIDAKSATSPDGVEWSTATSVWQKMCPEDCYPVKNRIVIASPHYHRVVVENMQRYQEQMLLLTVQAFVQACLNTISVAENGAKFLNWLIQGKGLFMTAEEIDEKVLPPYMAQVGMVDWILDQ